MSTDDLEAPSASATSRQPRGYKNAELLVRAAQSPDHPVVLHLLSELELDYPSRDLSRFFVGEIRGEIVGIAELKDYKQFWLLSCVGIKESRQGTGMGRALVAPLLESLEKDVYLYTLVPGFFQKLGFNEDKSPPVSLPPRLIYGCASCDPTLCLCLVKKPHATGISIV
jgi:N-acetylglutamate synthase-like GNAT family acetyltransferase